jgi:HEAT repeat protein
MAITKEKIKKWGEKGKVKKLIKTLEDSNKGIRIESARALGKIKDEKAVAPLIKVLEAGDIRIPAIEALAGIGDPKAVGPLVKILGHTNRSLRIHTAKALGGIGDPGAVEPLIKSLQDKDGDVVRHVAEALGRIGVARAVEPLLKVLNKGGDYVRKGAAEALKMLGWQPTNDEIGIRYYIAERNFKKCIEIGDPAVGPLIRNLDHSDPSVRLKAAGALKSIYQSENISPENKKALLKLKKRKKKIDRRHIDSKVFDPATCHKDHADSKQDIYFEL